MWKRIETSSSESSIWKHPFFVQSKNVKIKSNKKLAKSAAPWKIENVPAIKKQKWKAVWLDNILQKIRDPFHAKI
jgi:hypothetical protein